MLLHETVHIKDYGTARQLTLFEAGAPVLQVLTSDTRATGADLLCWLRARWRIENTFKYASEHNGIDALADYTMDIGPDTPHGHQPGPPRGPQTTRRRAGRAGRRGTGVTATAGRGRNPKQLNAALPAAHQRIAAAAAAAVTQATTALKPIPAKIAATDLDPHAQRARPRLARRGLQMVLRLLAFNTEAWLADHFNAYLADPNEHRAILRNLLHLGGQIHALTAITITLDRPDSPRVARALGLLTDELNTTPARIPGDRRPLTYNISPA